MPSVWYAARLAKDLDAKLLLVNVMNQRDIDMWRRIAEEYPPFSLDKQIKENTQDRQERFRELLEQVESQKRELRVETKIVRGVPFEALLNEVRQNKPDMLVMGTKGRSNLVDTIIGSCAQKMFRRCPVPLLSVRGDAG